MKITKLEVQNYKKIRMVALSPEGKSVVIGGKNGQGKSSCIDAYLNLMAGAKGGCVKPIRDGATKAVCGVEFDNGLTVRKTITSGGGAKLEVRDPQGALVSSPQGMLDALTGGMAFDVSEFVRLNAAAQTQLLCKIASLNLEKFETAEKAAYEKRTEANRDVKRLQAQVQGLPTHAGVPAAEVSIADLTTELNNIIIHNRTVDAMRRQQAEAEMVLKNTAESLLSVKAKIEELNAQAERFHASYKAQKATLDKAPALPVEKDASAVQAQIAGAEETNTKVRANAKRREVMAQLDAAEKEAQRHDKAVEEARRGRQQAIERADMPVEGLGVEDGIITFKGIPYSQISESEKYLVAAAIGLRSIPADGARVLIMRNGGSLDEENLRRICETVGNADAQLLIEVPRTSDGVDVVIEDGEIV